jgi:hypothetical protein
MNLYANRPEDLTHNSAIVIIIGSGSNSNTPKYKVGSQPEDPSTVYNFYIL